MSDIRQNVCYGSYLSDMGWRVERMNGINYFIKKFPLIGSFLKLQRPKKIDIDKINALKRKYNVFQVVVEPNSDKDVKVLKENGYKLLKSPYLPSKTLVINLKESEKSIISGFKKDARKIVNKNERDMSEGRSAFTIKQYSTPDEIKKWREGWKKNVNYKKYVPGEGQLICLEKSFPQNDTLFLASHNISGKIIGGALFTISREINDIVCYYWHGFSGKEGRTSLSQYSLLYRGILWGKSRGAKFFDFEGIYDSRFPDKSWLGFTHFKKSFGGQEVIYPGAYTKWSLPYLGTNGS